MCNSTSDKRNIELMLYTKGTSQDSPSLQEGWGVLIIADGEVVEAETATIITHIHIHTHRNEHIYTHTHTQ